MLIEIDSGGNENSRIVILMRIPLLSNTFFPKHTFGEASINTASHQTMLLTTTTYDTLLSTSFNFTPLP